MATNTKPLKQQSTDELEAAILAISAFIVAPHPLACGDW
jgi:hypothetical protein